jgi:hypothetical protein
VLDPQVLDQDLSTGSPTTPRAKALKHERATCTWPGRAECEKDRHGQVAEQIEGCSKTHAKWTASRQQATSRSEGRKVGTVLYP